MVRLNTPSTLWAFSSFAWFISWFAFFTRAGILFYISTEEKPPCCYRVVIVGYRFLMEANSPSRVIKTSRCKREEKTNTDFVN